MRVRREFRGVWCALVLAAHGCGDSSGHRRAQSDTRGAGAESMPPTTGRALAPEAMLKHPETPPAAAASASNDAPKPNATPDPNSAAMSVLPNAQPQAAPNTPPATSQPSVGPLVLPAVSAPVRLGTLAGHDMPHAQPNLHFFGTDTGSSYEHKGKLWMLFGDTWPTSDFICVNTRPDTDDSIAVLPLEYPGGVPALQFLTRPDAPNELRTIHLLRDGEALSLGPVKVPVTGFSDGEQAFALFQRLEPQRCDAPVEAGSMACATDDQFQCSAGLGLCDPQLVALRLVCDVTRAQTCLATQQCVGTSLCIDPNSSQYGDGHFVGQQAAVAYTLEFGKARDATPDTYDSILAWPTSKFMIPTARTVRGFTGKLAGNDYRPGHDSVLIWGRPGVSAEHEREGQLYLFTHRLPLPLDAAGKLQFAPQYFAGVDSASGEPRWSSHQSEAQALALDGKRGGDPHEQASVLGTMTVSWLGSPIDKWVMLYGGDAADFTMTDAKADRAGRTPGAIWIRFADQPWGPFSPPTPHLLPGDPRQTGTGYGPGGYLFHPNCVSAPQLTCAPTDPHRPLDTLLSGCPIAIPDQGRLYSPSIIDSYTQPNADGGLDMIWNVSTWDPYAVQLFRTSVQPASQLERPLDEVADERALARLSDWRRLPVLGETARYTQQSSHDRGTTDTSFPLSDHGNRDFNNFVCASANAQLSSNQVAPFKYDLPACPERYVRGAVLSRFEGAGHMLRMWVGAQSFMSGPPGHMLLRIYVDDDPRPRIDVPLAQALDGSAGEIFAPPFGAGSPLRMAWYYPVSFRKKLIVALDQVGDSDEVFYQCDVVSEPPSPEPLSAARLDQRELALQQLGAVFHPAGSQSLLRESARLSLAAGARQQLELSGPATIHELQVRVHEADLSVLTTVRVRARWDGAQAPAIELSVADLLGGSVPPEVSSLALTSVAENGDRILTLKLPMPFRERAQFEFENTGTSSASFELRFVGEHSVPSEAFGHLHVQRTETLGPTLDTERVAVEAQGRGRLVGTCNQVVGHADPNAGYQSDPLNLLEGDVRIQIDGELALNGTGSEEYADDVFYFKDAPHGNAFAQAWGVTDTQQTPAGRASFCHWHVLGGELDYNRSLRMVFEVSGTRNPSIVERHQTVAYLYQAD
jgi:hypothetical protein